MTARAPALRTLLTLIRALPCVIAASPALAADPSGSYAVKDVGLARCGDFVTVVKEQKSDQLGRYVGWVGGYITASNQHSAETFDLTPWQNSRTITLYLVNHCDKNPDLRFGAAVVQLAAALTKDRLKEKTELVPIEHEGKTHYVYKEAVRRAQVALTELGMYTGSVDGTLSDTMRDAIKAFQAKQSLPQSGLPDQATLFKLLQPPG